MTSFLVDVNVWLALSWGGHVHSEAAHRWLKKQQVGQSTLLFCRVSQLGLLRLLTNKTVLAESSLNIPDALKVFEAWGQDDRISFVVENTATELCFQSAAESHGTRAGNSLVTDAYLVGFAESHSVSIATFDKGLAKLANLRGVPVVLLPQK